MRWMPGRSGSAGGSMVTTCCSNTMVARSWMSAMSGASHRLALRPRASMRLVSWASASSPSSRDSGKRESLDPGGGSASPFPSSPVLSDPRSPDGLRRCSLTWDDDAPLPDEGYSTAFLFRQPADPARTVREDLQRLASPKDSTPLAVLALRGLRQLRIGDDAWDLTHHDGIISLCHPERDMGLSVEGLRLDLPSK